MVLELPGCWVGWKIQKRGKSKDESLIAPDGSYYSPGEILEILQMTLNLDYLQVENKRLKQLVAAHAIHLTPDEVVTLQETAAIIEATLPRKKQLRFPSIRTISQKTHDNSRRPATRVDRYKRPSF